MQFNKGGKWLLSVAIIALLASTPLMAVEGAGSYRGSGTIIPYFSNTNSVITFIRFINAFSLNESPWNGDVDQRDIWIHITYLTPNRDNDPTRCNELDSFFPMTRQDYYLLNVRSDQNSPAPFRDGYAVAWAVADDGGFPDAKIHHNQIAADQVTVDIANGSAWGMNDVQFRAQYVDGDQFDDNDGITPDDWFNSGSDAEEYAILGQDPDTGFSQYENIRFAENFYPTTMASNANISGARTLDGGTRYYIVPLSWIEDNDGNIPGTPVDDATVLVPETLGPDIGYTNQYNFEVRLFDSDENRLSLPAEEVICWACLSELDLAGAAGDQFLKNTSGLERGQGWFEFNGRGLQTLTPHGPSGTYTYMNRAIVVQSDALRIGGDQVAWGLYPVHDRTTAEITPDPNSYDAEGEYGSQTDPNSTPTY
jgi:hypothetical protein